MDVTSLGFRTDLALLERSGSTIVDHGDHLVVTSPANPGFYWGNFLLLDHVPARNRVDEWLQRFTAAFPEAQHRALGFDNPRGSLTTYGHGAWFGAFLDGVLVAQMGLVRAGAGLARFQAVETHPDQRGRGLAGTLVHHVSGYGFTELGAHTLVMVADPGYHAIRVYRAVGFDGTEAQ